MSQSSSPSPLPPPQERPSPFVEEVFGEHRTVIDDDHEKEFYTEEDDYADWEDNEEDDNDQDAA